MNLRWNTRRVLGLAVVAATLVLSTLTRAQEPAPRATGPWDVPALLASPPKATWGTPQGLVREVTYEGEPLDGRPTRVFAYYARPATGDGPFPGMVLVHGGGGTAFREWAELWAKRGYTAIAMDLAGHGPDGKRLPDGAPDQDDDGKFGDFRDDQVKRMWTYHAVADVLRGHALLAARPEVDRERIGVTGISWGGYLTCIVAGVDHTLKVAVPVYGCGFLQDDSVWLPLFAKMSPAQKDRWVRNFEPSRYLAGVTCPILFVNGTNDFAYPLGSYRKSYRLVTKAPRSLCVTVKMPHGHGVGWAPNEIGLFVDSVLTGGKPLATLSPLVVEKGRVSATVKAVVPVVSAKVHYTTGTGPWQPREWTTRDAVVSDGRITAELPGEPITAVFLTARDARGAVVSTEHAEPMNDGK
jgi:dienelactone hydrolase